MKRWRSNLHLCASHYIKITTTILKTPVQPQLQLRSGYCYSCRELASAIIGHHRSGCKMVSVSVGSQVCGVSFCVSQCCQMSSRSACGAIRGGCSGTLVLMVALFPRSSVSTIECPIGHPTCPERWLLNGIWGKTLRSTLFARWYVETMLRLCWDYVERSTSANQKAIPVIESLLRHDEHETASVSTSPTAGFRIENGKVLHRLSGSAGSAGSWVGSDPGKRWNNDRYRYSICIYI